MRTVLAIAIAVFAAGCLQGPPGPPGPAGPAGPAGGGALSPEEVRGGPGAGGGSVRDVPPTVTSFSGSLANADNSGGSEETFTGVARDANTEFDFIAARLTVTLAGPAATTFNRTVAFADVQAASEPATFGPDGWKVWGGTRNDGDLHFKFRYRYGVGTPAGTYTFSVSVTPALRATVAGGSDVTNVTVFSEITIAARPVEPDGSNSTSNSWGLWEAAPGAANVESRNYLRLVNTGQRATASVVVDFTEAAFIGVDDANFTVPINGNLQFAWWEGPAGTTAPGAGSYTWLTASADGSVAVTFSGLQKVIFVKYRVVQLPAVLPAQAYGAGYTATEL